MRFINKLQILIFDSVILWLVYHEAGGAGFCPTGSWESLPQSPQSGAAYRGLLCLKKKDLGFSGSINFYKIENLHYIELFAHFLLLTLDELSHFCLRQLGPSLFGSDHKCLGHFARALVWYADNGAVTDGRMGEEHIFKLGRGHLQGKNDGVYG
jgi:hypothetical protein